MELAEHKEKLRTDPEYRRKIHGKVRQGGIFSLVLGGLFLAVTFRSFDTTSFFALFLLGYGGLQVFAPQLFENKQRAKKTRTLHLQELFSTSATNTAKTKTTVPESNVKSPTTMQSAHMRQSTRPKKKTGHVHVTQLIGGILLLVLSAATFTYATMAIAQPGAWYGAAGLCLLLAIVFMKTSFKH